MAWPYSDNPLSAADLAQSLNFGGAAFNAPGATQLNTNALLTGSGLGSAASEAAGAGGSFMDAFRNIFNMDSAFGKTKDGVTTMGWAPAALGIGQSIFGALQGRQAMGLAQDQLKESRRQFDLNFGAQRQSINTELEDRQRARVASNPNAYESVDTYLEKNRIR
jgi:hypothetical protein